MAFTLWASTQTGAALGDGGPISVAISGNIILSELGQSNTSSVVLAAADARAILALQPYTLISIVQDDVGSATADQVGAIFTGYVVDAAQQIDDTDRHTITLTLAPLTQECQWRLTRRGWTANRELSVVALRLAALVPGWTGRFVAQPSDDFIVSVNLNSPTALGGFQQVAKQFGQWSRQGVDFTGEPARILEMGQFGAAPTVTLQDAKGGDAAAMQFNTAVALSATIERHPADATQLVNICVPFGGGSTSDSLVTLERLWRIVNDPQYVNFGRYGTDAESIARTGLGTLFPEYDTAYPITDPLNLPTGQFQFIFFNGAGNAMSPAQAAPYGAYFGPADGNGNRPIVAYVIASGNPSSTVTAALAQGQYATRAVTNDGHYDYVVYDAVSYAQWGHREGQMIDSALVYADSSPANQELTARALYIETTTLFKRYSQPHHAFSCTAPGVGRPTRAGDLIAVDYQRGSVDDAGRAVVEMDAVDTLRVMSVVRAFDGDAPATDTYTLSNLGRFAIDDAGVQANQAATMVALQRTQGTSIAPMTVNDRGNVDALHPLVTHVSVPTQKFRWQRCNFRVDFLPYTGTATTAENTPGTLIAIIGDDGEAGIPHGDHTLDALTGGSYDETEGFATTSDAIPAAPKHHHQVSVFGSNPGAPTASSNWLFAQFSAALGHLGLFSNNNTNGWIETNDNITSVDTSPTKHPHKSLISKAVAVVTRLTAFLPQHTHPLNQQIPDGPTPVSCLVTINGQALSSGLTLLSGARDASGAFTGSFEVDDISPILNGITGDLTFVLTPGTSASNPFGVGLFHLSSTMFGEWGGLTSNVTAT